MDWLLAAYLITAGLDWHQTQQIHTHPGLHETNPLIGAQPDNGRVNRYFLTSMALTIGAAEVFPEMRVPILGGATVVHIVCIGKNKQLGLSWGF